MLWFIIGAVIVLILTVIAVFNEYQSDWPEWSAVFFTFFVSALIAFFAAGAVNFVTYFKVDEPVQKYTAIANLSDGSGVSGSFFLGIGSVDSKPVYMYYTDKNGVFELHQLEARRAYVTYTDGRPQVVIHTDRSTNKWISVVPGWDYTYEFQVPRGSVRANFNLDAQ